MIIAVLSDTHIPHAAADLPEKVYSQLSGCDLILHAGDIASEQFLEKLKKIAKVVAVAGNMDSPQLQKILPRKQVIECGKFTIGLVHGFGNPKNMVPLLSAEFDQPIDVLVFGHSHQVMNEVKDGIIYFNPGSPTDDAFAPFKSYGIIEINDTIQCKIVKVQDG